MMIALRKKNCWLSFFLVAVFLWGAVNGSVAKKSELLQDLDVLYLEGNIKKPLQHSLKKMVYVYFGKDLGGVLNTIPAGETIEVVGYHAEALLVRGKNGGNKIEGWVPSDTVPPIAKEILDEARAEIKRKALLVLAIKERRVIEGMKPDEVKQALGKPERVFFKKRKGKRVDFWSYTAYKKIPRSTYTRNRWGELVAVIVYEKVPIGKKTIEFEDGLVVGFEESRIDNL